MSYCLVVAEKPSVGAAYAKVLGATNRQDGYWEGNGYLVSWCVGHLVELAPPNVYDAKYVKWSIADLPILPEKWQYLVSTSTKKQFGILQKVMNRPDVDSIVCATDAGREGELIFRLVYQQAGCKKPFSRLWLSSMEENAIREGFAHLKPSTEYDALYNAALCRERADWMVGINASRLFSCLYGQPLAVGRVMTPVLAMTVVREAAIAAFVPEKFYTVALTLADGGSASSKRFAQKMDAERLLSKCRKEERVTVQKMKRKEKYESPPPLYDLTALQRDANRLLGFTAQQTLDYAQSLYEKRLITYPRTDSRFLTEDMAASIPGLVTDTGKVFAVEKTLPIHVRQVINGSKVTDHHALLPTKSMANADLAALPVGGAECPAVDCRTAALRRRRTAPLCRNHAHHRMCRGGIYRQGQGGSVGGLESHGAENAGRTVGQAERTGYSARCAGAEPVQHCRCRTERGSNDPAEALYRGHPAARYGNRQCRQYAGGRGASGHRHPGHPRRNY